MILSFFFSLLELGRGAIVRYFTNASRAEGKINLVFCKKSPFFLNAEEQAKIGWEQKANIWRLVAGEWKKNFNQSVRFAFATVSRWCVRYGIFKKS